MRSNLLGYVFKIIISALLIISLCIAIRNDEEKDLLRTYKVVDKKEYIDSSYLFFLNKMRVETRYYVVLEDFKTKERFILKNVKLEEYYNFEVGKKYNINDTYMRLYGIRR